MTSTRDDTASPGAVGPGERSVVRSLRGLRWWGSLALAAVLTGAGIAVDLLTSGELGVVFTACFAGGCILATAWARRDSLFVPLVQPPLLLAVGVPVVVAATGGLSRARGTASALLAIGGPLVNAFPTLAITTAVSLALGFVRTRLEPYRRADDDLDPDARPARDPRDRDPRDRDPRERRPREPRDRDPRDRDPRDRDRDPRDRDPRDRDPRDRDPRDRDPRERRPREPRDRDRDPRDRDPRDRDPRDRDPRDRDARDRDPRDRDRPKRVPVEARPARERDARRRPSRPDDPDDEFGPGVRRVPRRVDGPDTPR
ncbi:hypothetical protein Acsp06_29710 [Actinomycetospora sp. NBRC 106375]|uniref:DUF6542 domain-containing protein n=1 Tax=Actinomycetospora sp. NBRC 106375 TaxID=3032207 RepID=UPI0024A5782A|nr:DUF6542 domain-containing protein [Actinomycetospora sp. NBRC 106375]GLZ46786.1 hypothetical protein Acsp06_29710 [Actinomycetospora sp. NBRC 106375]